MRPYDRESLAREHQLLSSRADGETDLDIRPLIAARDRDEWRERYERVLARQRSEEKAG